MEIGGGNIVNPNSTGSEITSATFGIGQNIHLEERQVNGAFSDRTDLAIVTNTGFGLGESEKIRIEAGGSVGVGTASPTAMLTVNGQITGGFGAETTGGTADWNHVTNARSGMGRSLLLGTHTNGNGLGFYYHVVNYEYVSKDGSGNMTQVAIPYNHTAIYTRYRYSGSWSSWGAV